MADPIRALHELGQSLWYDNIQRRLLENGELETLITRGDIRGITSNPSIFESAISKSSDYDAALVPLAWSGLDSRAIFDQLAAEDIRAAADLFRSLYEESGGGDGYVSLEVDPALANDSERTAAEAQRLWQLVDRPNLMVKIPATPAGLPAITQSILAGINVNVTLIFSLVRYGEVIAAYLAGLERRLSAGMPVDRIASVASFFVSRVDSKVDKRLDEIIRKEDQEAPLAATLRGKAAVANARLAYAQFLDIFQGEEYQSLRSKGARLQRPLWASTSTKDPAYTDVKYVEELIGAQTINTVPHVTLEAFRDHGQPTSALPGNLDEARLVIDSLESLGISMDQVTQELEEEGVRAFAEAFERLMETIEKKRSAAVHQLGPLAGLIPDTVKALQAASFSERMFSGDASLWSADLDQQADIRKRLGWLWLPTTSAEMLADLEAFGEEIQRGGVSKALLLGLGGSSLASEVLSLVFSPAGGHTGGGVGVEMKVLDSTSPEQILAAESSTAGEKTLYIVASKSGGTTEVTALLEYFWAHEQQKNPDREGEAFIAITDPGTSLERLANVRGFRRVFLADPTVGGRNSALSAFGLVPATLFGINLKRLLDKAAWMAGQCSPEVPAARNPGLVLGAILGVAALEGLDKLTLIADPQLAMFGTWLEQLVAESTGKVGKGILPVEGEQLGAPEEYGEDRLFVYLRWEGRYDEQVKQFQESGFPVLVFPLEDEYDLGAEFYRWEVGTAVASSILGVNSFDQPDVQDNKERTRVKIQEYRQLGKLDEGQPAWQGQGVAVYGVLPPEAMKTQSLQGLIQAFLAQSQAGDYVALNAYLPRDQRHEVLLQRLRVAIRERTRLATTVGFGPRFLHSTGQFHKGGPNTGLFLQFTADAERDLEIPGQGLTFGTLLRAQALGDLEALMARGRRVMRIHLQQANILDVLVDELEA